MGSLHGFYLMVLRKSFYIHWSAGRSPRVHEVNPGRDPSLGDNLTMYITSYKISNNHTKREFSST